MNVRLRVHNVRKMPVLEIQGEITGETIGKITSKLDALRRSKSPTIVVDLTSTTFVDSHGLGAFVYCWRLLDEEKRSLVFVNPQGFVRNMFTGTNLDRVFRIAESLEEL